MKTEVFVQQILFVLKAIHVFDSALPNPSGSVCRPATLISRKHAVIYEISRRLFICVWRMFSRVTFLINYDFFFLHFCAYATANSRGGWWITNKQMNSTDALGCCRTMVKIL
jgi:hypothetical protein